jgi:hypothetical protein
MKTALILIEGVLRKAMGGQPIPEGVRLYSSLAVTGQVVLLSTATRQDREQTEDWLELHGLTGHATVAWGDIGPRVSLANMYRRGGYDVDLVVDPDPEQVRDLIAAGFNTLLFTHAQYAHPEWRPDTDPGVQPWDSITQQVADLARAKAADARLKGE